MATNEPATSIRSRKDPPARSKLGLAFAGGLIGGVAAGLAGAGRSSPLIGWDVLDAIFCAWTWIAIWNGDAASTAQRARREDPGRAATEIVLVAAAVASLGAVGVVLFGASHAPGNDKYWQAALAVGSVIESWVLLHTLFTLKYAELYYTGSPNGIDFNEDAPPQFSDFAYLAFTIGMTFQVSDTDLKTKEIRRTALRHAWLSFPLATVIIAGSINLVSGLAK